MCDYHIRCLEWLCKDLELVRARKNSEQTEIRHKYYGRILELPRSDPKSIRLSRNGIVMELLKAREIESSSQSRRMSPVDLAGNSSPECRCQARFQNWRIHCLLLSTPVSRIFRRRITHIASTSRVLSSDVRTAISRTSPQFS